MSMMYEVEMTRPAAYVIIDPTTELTSPLADDELTGNDAAFDQAEHVITQYVFGALFILGVLGNGICFVVLQHDEFRQASMRFTLSALALVDTALLVFGLLRQWLWEVLGRDPRSYHVFLCKTMYFGVYFFGQLSPWTIVLLTLERSVSVFFPLKAKTMCSTRRVVLSWLLTAFFLTAINIHTFVKVDLYRQNASNSTSSLVCRHRVTWEYLHMRVWFWVDFLLVTVLPFIVITTCNVAIIGKLRQTSVRRTSRLGASPERGDCGGQSITSMLVMVSVVFLLTTTPLQLFFLTADLTDHPLTDLIMAVCNFLYYLNSSTNFILYCVSGSIFRRAFMATFARGPANDNDSNSSFGRLANGKKVKLKPVRSLPELCGNNQIQLQEIRRINSYNPLPADKRNSYHSVTPARNGGPVCEI